MNEEYKLNPMRLSDNLPSDWLDNLHNQIVALQKENDALRKQLETKLTLLHGILVRYKYDPFYKAENCIEDALAEIERIGKGGN